MGSHEQETEALRKDFVGFFKSRIADLLPLECRVGSENINVSMFPSIQTGFNINYVLRNGDSERRSEKQDIPESKTVRQSLQLYAATKGALLKRIHIIVESPNYFFEYP